MLMTVKTTPCIVCKKPSELEVPVAGWSAWQSGTHIQDAFPTLSPDDRELLISGTHPACWTELFGEPEDEGIVHLARLDDSTKPRCGAEGVPASDLTDESEFVECDACLNAP